MDSMLGRLADSRTSSFDTHTLVKALKKPDLLPVENPGLNTVQDGNNDGSMRLDLGGNKMTELAFLPYPFIVFRMSCWLWTGGGEDPCTGDYPGM